MLNQPNLEQEVAKLNPPTPEELATQKKEKAKKKELMKEAVRQRELVKEKIFPILLKAKSIKDAKNICKTLSVGMDAVFHKTVKDYTEYLSGEKLSVLKLKGFMNEGKEYELEWELMEILQDEKISDVKGLVEGMDKEIERLLEKEILERKLDTLKTEWL